MIRINATVLSVSLALATTSLAGEHDHHHAHGAADGGAADARPLSKLALKGGKKWQTDEQLRAGMAAMRDDVQAAIEPIHGGKYAAKDYEALAARIEKQITTVIAKCKLAPEVDAQVHLVLGEILSGTDVMKKDGDRKKGVVAVIEAL